MKPLRSLLLLVIIIPVWVSPLIAEGYEFDTILYGASYYHEYMPYERLDEDIATERSEGVHRLLNRLAHDRSGYEKAGRREGGGGQILVDGCLDRPSGIDHQGASGLEAAEHVHTEDHLL